MRLLFLSNVFPSPVHPTKGVFNLRMVEGLRALGHDVEVICPIAWTDWLRADRASRQKLRMGTGFQGTGVSYPRYYFTPRILTSTYAWSMWQGIRNSVERIIAEQPLDAVIGYWAHPDGRCAIQAARKAGVPAIVMVGGSDVLLLTKNRRRRQMVHDVLRDADAVVPVSDHIRTKLIRDGVDLPNVTVVRRGIDTTQFCPGDRPAARRALHLPSDLPLLLWVGRLTPVKGLPVLLESLKRLQNEGVSVLTCLVGSGEQAQSLRADIKRHGLETAVRLVGSIPHDQLPDWYRAADLTVLPSLSEGVPNVLLESIACGTPFAASDVGGISEIATPGLDRLVPAGDAPALAAAIRSHLAAPHPEMQRAFHPDGLPEAANRLIDVVQSVREPESAKQETKTLPCLPLPVA
jgi:teichuronic acid biosynthesis glycosyltransferase TuaC